MSGPNCISVLYENFCIIDCCMFYRLGADESCIVTHLLWINDNELIYCKSIESETSICLAEINWTSTEIVTRCVELFGFTICQLSTIVLNYWTKRILIERLIDVVLYLNMYIRTTYTVVYVVLICCQAHC